MAEGKLATRYLFLIFLTFFINLIFYLMRQKQFLLAFLAMLLCFAAPSFAQNVAKIGDTGYETLQKAMTEANKAAGDYTITLLQNSAEVFTFAQKSGVNITIDGDDNTFSGKITLNAGSGNLTFTDAKIVPANSQSIYLNATTAPNITFDGCTLQGANKSGTIIYAYASATNNALTVKNCTADNLQYIVSCRQTGSSSVLVENVTASNMIYLVRTLKCPSVTIKNVTVEDAVIGVDIKNDAAGGKLTLENVDINIVTYNGSLYVPVSGSGAGKTWTVELKGNNTFSANGAAYEDNSWFSGNAGYEIKDLNVAKIGDKLYYDFATAIAAAESGATVEILKDIKLDNTVVIPAGKSITLNLNEKTISQKKACTASYQMIENNGDLTITGNGKLSFKDTGAGDPTFGWGSYTIYNRGTLVVENGTIEHLGEQNPGNGQPNQHMYCAIFQYSGSTTIKDGKISTPTYRSARLWKGDMTINGGKFEGQLWVQAVDNTAKLTINNGTFAPKGNDGSSVFVTNDQYNVAFAVENGTFNGKIGCSDATKLAGTIKGGKFNAAAMEGTNSSLLAEGVKFGEKNNDGYYEVVSTAKVAEVDGVGYETLAAAQAAAQAGQTITFMADITEDVTISKAVTIDGADKTYTGAMTVKVDATIKNVNFDGKGYNGYAITTRGANYLTIEDCTAKNYGYGFVQLASGTALTTVKNVTVSDMNYGVKVDYSNAVVLENVDITAGVAAVLNSNYGEKTITIKDSELNILGTWTRNNTTKTTYVFDGANTIDQFIIDTAIDNFKLAVGATLTAPNDITVTTDECGYDVRYKDGKYYLVEVEAEVGNKKYETLAMALAAAQADDTITLLRDITSSEIIVLSKAITLDGNGKTLKSTAGRAINVDGVNGVIIKNLTINASDERAINVINNATNVTVEGVTATAANYTVNLAASAANAVVVIKDSNLTGLNVVNVAAANAQVTINGGTITCNDQNDAENYAALALNKAAVNANIVATGVTFDIKGDSVKASNGAEGGYIKIDGEEAGNKIVAVIEYEGTDNYYSFYTLADAVAKAQAGETVKLITDATGAGVVIDKNITIDFNGKTYTANEGVGSAGTQTLGLQILKDNNVTLKNGTLKSEGGNVKMLVQNYANLIVDNMKLVDATDAILYVLSNNSGNVVVKGTSEITANGAIAFDACKYANYELPTVTIAEGVVVTGDVEVSATLNFAGTLNGNIIINGAEGVVNSTVEGLNVTTTIEGRNVVYANGAYTTAEFEPVAEVNGQKYASLREAVDAAPAGATVELLADVTLVGGNEKDAEAGLVIDKAMTLDGKGYTIDCGTFVKGIRIYGPSALTDIKINNVTIVNNKATGRCVDTRSGYLRLKFNNANLIAHGTNSQPLTVGGNEKLHQIDLSGCTIDAGNSGYGIISFVPTNQAIKVMNSTVTGYAGIYLKGDDTKVTITTNSEVIGKNVHSGATNAFGAVVFEGNNNVVNINATSPMLKAIAEGDQAQAAILVKSGEGNKVVFETNKKAEILAEGENAYWAMVSAEAIGTTITKDGVAVALGAECDGFQFLTLEDALRFSKDGSTVKLLANVALDTKKLVAQNDGYATLINVKDKAITLDLNGKTINVAAAASDLANTKGGMLLSVFHADTNGQLTLADSEQTGAVIVNANDAKIYCLAASESQYNDKSNSGKIIVNGGTYTLDRAADSMFFSDANEVITINGGNFTLRNVGTGSNGMPWIFNTYERNERHVNVNGGTFNADINHQYWAFEVNVPNDRALRNNGDGTWTVVNAEAWVLEEYNANYNREVGYATLEEALAVSNNVNNTVTLANNLTRAGLVINKDITIDFNGMTYTANEGVGSAGTQTLGLQILKDNNVTLKNGTLTSEGDKVKMLVQNYANLTVENMNLVDATDVIQYVLSNNSGNVAVKGNTNITTNAVAFDACKYANYAIPTVTVETTGRIAGNIEVTGGNLVIKAGTFTQDVNEWCAPYTVCTKNNNGTWTVEYRWMDAVTINDNYDFENGNDDFENDNANFENDKEYTVGTITYNRYFGNTEWQTIYLPFAVPASVFMAQGLEVAYIYNASYKGNVAAIDYVVVGSDYTLEANYPYLIKANSTGEKSIVVKDATLMPTEVNSINCSSVFETFEFTGSYTTVEGEPCADATAEVHASKGHFVMNEGAWKKFDVINPFRVYLTITLRNGSEFAYPTEESIIMRKVDKNGNVDTSVEKIGVDADILGIYDLQGRRVLEPQKGEIYIINGKKVVF